MAVVYQERYDGVSPFYAGAAVDGGSSTRILHVPAVGPTDLQTAITDLLGTTNVNPTSTGKLNRTPPRADPQFPYWFANAVKRIQGLGGMSNQNSLAGMEVPTIQSYALYSDYDITVEFTPRPFPVVNDSAIGQSIGTWFQMDDSGGNHQISYNVVNEWDRWTDFDLQPQNDNVTGQQGGMVFQSTGAANNVRFNGQPRMFLPNQILTFTWYQVPFRFITSANSYIANHQWQGCINQNPWNGYPAGSLLYLGYKYKKYTPPVQSLQIFNVLGFNFETLLNAYQKLCDIHLIFLYTTRTAIDLPAAPNNKNFIQAGHNLLPWLIDRQFHFAMSNPSAAQIAAGAIATPSWFSFPVELLWYDPDSPQIRPIKNRGL